MDQNQALVRQVLEARQDNDKADVLIRQYLPFIRAEASKQMDHPCTDQDDQFSIALIAFHEAITGYDPQRGAFLSYAATLIRSRLIDEHRRESRHQGVLSLDAQQEDGLSLADRTRDDRDHYAESMALAATQQEIAELSGVLARFGVTFTHVAEHCPKQDRTLQACLKAIRYAGQNRSLLNELLESGKLPMSRLVEGSGADRKTLERHRKYILAMLLIQTNGYEIIRGHLHQVWKKGEAAL